MKSLDAPVVSWITRASHPRSHVGQIQIPPWKQINEVSLAKRARRVQVRFHVSFCKERPPFLLNCLKHLTQSTLAYTGLSKKMDGILNRYNLKSTGRIYTIGVLKCSEKFKVLDLP